MTASVLAIVSVGVAIFTAAAVTDPTIVANLLNTPQPTATLFVLNPTATADPRGTLPATWTASPTIPLPNTATASATPTITATPTATTTRIPTLTFTPINTVSAGWYEFQSKEARIAIQFTATWTAVTLTGRDASETLTQITVDDPVLAASLRDGLGIAVVDDLAVVAFDTATEGDPYIINMTIAYAAEAGGVAEVRDAHLQIYENSTFYEVLSTDSTHIDGKLAERIRYTTNFSSESGETTIYHQEVIAEQRRESDPLIIITLSTSERRRNIYEALLDRIVASIRYLR